MKKTLLIGGLFLLAQMHIPAFAAGGEEASLPDNVSMEQVTPDSSINALPANQGLNAGDDAMDASLTEGLGSSISNTDRSAASISAANSGASSTTKKSIVQRVAGVATKIYEALAPTPLTPMLSARYRPKVTYSDGIPLNLGAASKSSRSAESGRASMSRISKNSTFGALKNIASKVSADWDAAFKSPAITYGSFNSSGGTIGNGPSGNNGDADLPKLGKTEPRYDRRTLQAAKYMRSSLPPAPAQVDFSKAVTEWGMMDNDKIGDCTVAAAGHSIQQWTANAGQEQTPPDSKILKVYEAISGYRPGHPDTDAGANLIDVLNYWRQDGIDGHTIAAFAQVNMKNQEEVKQVLNIFGNIYMGVALPISAQGQKVWDVPPGGAVGDGAPGSWGGHAINMTAYGNLNIAGPHKPAPNVPLMTKVTGYDDQYVYIVTWGGIMPVTWNFFMTYMDEGYAVITQDFLKNGKTPNNGFDEDTLNADLQQVTADNISNTADKVVNSAVNWVRRYRAQKSKA